MGQYASSIDGFENDPDIQKLMNDEYDYEYDFESPRFSINNTEETLEGVKYLDEHGYVVFADVLSKEEVSKNFNLFWEFLESINTSHPIDRNNPKTWEKFWPGSPNVGLVNSHGIGQSNFMWSVRGNPNVKKVFSQIWNSNELLVSFDGAGCFRDWKIKENWKTVGNWFHCDQSPLNKTTRCAVQGLVSLTDANKSTGGLVVVPDSFKHFIELQKIQNPLRKEIDYINVPRSHAILQKTKPRLVNCKAGDLILWDSRCIHCNTPGLENAERVQLPDEAKGLIRLVGYVCMVPRSMFTPTMMLKNFEQYEEIRKTLVRCRTTCSHWPLELTLVESRAKQNPPLMLNTFQQSLINGENIEYDPNSTLTEF